MCAALAARKDPAEELEFAVPSSTASWTVWTGVRTGVHVCRGNWSRDEATLLQRQLPAPRAVSRAACASTSSCSSTRPSGPGSLLAFPGKELGLGVVNPRSGTVETRGGRRARSVLRALEQYPADRLFLNPDCGFGTFSNRPMNDAETALAKVTRIVQAARELRAEYGHGPGA